MSIDARRPLKSRATSWAVGLSKVLLRGGVSPNGISMAGVVFAIGAFGLFCWASLGDGSKWWLLGAAGAIQLRLICNLMDGMVAIEGGKKTATGDLFNEVPDRFADGFIIMGFAMAGGAVPWAIHLGWLAAVLAVMTAYVRLQGAVLTGSHDFCGPQGKPQRMALITVSTVILPFWSAGGWLVTWVLATMVLGEMVTVWRRLSRIAKRLQNPTG